MFARTAIIAALATALTACQPQQSEPAADTPAAAPAAPNELTISDPAPVSASMGDWAGRYSVTRDNGNVGGESFQTTDVVDIVPIDDATAFIEANLFFFNGHTCFVAGLAKLESRTLVFRGTEDGVYPGCVLTLSRTNEALAFSDPDSQCTMSACGVRGSLVDFSMPLSGQKPHTVAELEEIKGANIYLVATGQQPGEKQ